MYTSRYLRHHSAQLEGRKPQHDEGRALKALPQIVGRDGVVLTNEQRDDRAMRDHHDIVRTAITDLAHQRRR